MKNGRHTWLKILLGGTVVVALVLGVVHFGVDPAFAQDTALEDVGEEAGLAALPLGVILGRIISVFLGLLGLIFLVLIIYAGYLWMTAAGNPERVEKAKKLITQAVVGLIIILASYAITSFVIGAITGQGLWQGPGAGGPGTGSGTGGPSIEQFSGSLGSGGIRDHYPERNAADVARNTKIFVTFRDQMDIPSLVSGYDTAGTPLDTTDDTVTTELNTDNIQIYENADGPDGAFETTEVSVGFTDDLRTFVFTPPILGSATTDTQYSVRLSDRILNADGDGVVDSGGYLWSFTVGTEIDLEPPTITRVAPREGGTFGRNITVEVHFSEAMDPTSASGLFDPSVLGADFSNIRTSAAEDGPIAGEYSIVNEYTTVVFRPLEACGTNSCGQTLFCLAPDDEINVDVIAATPGVNPPQADVFPYDGVVDLAGNALDGNGDGTAGDAFSWAFTTSNDIVLGAPEIESISPNIDTEEVDLDQEVTVTFSEQMLSSTLTASNIILTPDPNHEMWFRPTSTTLEDEDTGDRKTQVTIGHGVFLESTDVQTYQYGAFVNDEVQNRYQNCFRPSEGPNMNGGTCGTSPSSPYCCNGTPSSQACSLF